MKKTKNSLKLAVGMALGVLTAMSAFASFAKTNTYPDGKFTDVTSTKWYASEVKSAYELGFMNGQSDVLFAPEGNVTVAEGITIASRVHAIYNNKEIESVDNGGKWYDMYVAYAKENGIITEESFTNYDRNIMRYETALLFANALPCDYFAQRNDIKDIPDVAKTEDYYDELMMLYRAGVVMGSDDYGNFYATNPITRSETAAIVNRVALPENRKSATLVEYGERNQAVYLINNRSMGRAVRGTTYIASGWTYENPGLSSTEKKDYSDKKLVDTSEIYGITARRDITVQTGGKVVFEAIAEINNDGARLVFEDSSKNEVFGIFAQDTTYKVFGKAVVDTKTAFIPGKHRFYIVLDLDNSKATVVINGKELGTYETAQIKDLASVAYKTTEKDMLTISLLETHMYVNYAVNDTFRTSVEGEKLYGWSTTENVGIHKRASDYDHYSAVIENNGSAVKKFDKVSGQFVYETYIEVPDGMEAVLELKKGSESAVKVEIGKGNITSEGKLCRQYNSTLWNLVRIEGNTDTGKAVIRINGKTEKTEVALSQKEIDTVSITAKGNGKVWFDDVQVYNVYDFADYVPIPNPVNNDDFYLGMSICSLWHEGSHAGWDYISPYDDLEPVLGYYDEGLPEVSDWEIKFLSEHGYDFQHFCWYLSERTEGIKRSGHSYALHDGYMNAKYSDMMKFAIMWENWSSKLTKEYFLEEVWPYWCEWYFTDSRYMRIDNKAVLTIYRHPKFIEQMGSEDAAKEVIAFMKEDIKNYGYDGLILLGTSSGSLSENKQADYIGIDGFVAYHFGSAAYNPDHQINSMNTAFDNGYTPFLPSVGVGFNDIGWDETKRVPLATVEGHKSVFEWARDDYLPRLASREGEEWMGKFAVANTWNEFGEGHYIFPTNLNKFGYLDAARQVFSTAAGKDDSKHFDIEPTDNQKARLGYLYPARNIPLRRTHYISDETEISKNKVIKVWNFENEADCGKWSTLAKTTPTKYDEAEKALTAQTLHNDAHIKMNNIEENRFNADEVRYIHIQMKTDVGANTEMEVFYSTEEGFNWSSSRRAVTLVGNNGQYVDYYIDMAGKQGWSGTIKALRLDPMGKAGNFWIKKIELLSDRSADAYNINVKGVDYNFNPSFYKKSDGEVYIGANPGEGFYSLCGFYYEWNRWDGKLMIRTYTGVEFDFTVGSNKVLVDGREMTLSSSVELVDGLPLIPIIFIYDNAGYVYEKTEDGLKVNIKGIDVGTILSERIANVFEFNVPGDGEGWRISGAEGDVIDSGVMYFEALDNAGRFDSQIVLDKPSLKASDYCSAEIRIKPVYKDDFIDNTIVMYFSTDTEPNLNEKKTARIALENLEPDIDGYYTGVFNFSENPSWKGNIKMLRFDPPNRPGEFYIDYIRFIEDPEKEAKAAAEEEKRKEEQAKLEAELAAQTVYSIKFDNPDLFRVNGVDGLEVDGTLKGTSVTGDPSVTYTQKLNLNASDITYIKVKAKIPTGCQAEMFFSTDEKNFGGSTRFFFVSKSDDVYTYIIDTTKNENWKGTIREFRFDPVMNEGLYFEWYSIEFCGKQSAGEEKAQEPAVMYETVYSIKFDNPDLFRVNGVDGLEVDGAFKGISTTADPNATYTQKLNLNADEIKCIKISAKIPSGCQAEMFFSTDEKNFGGSTRFFFVSKSDDVYTYIIDTTKNENWKGTIREFRFDPVIGEGVYFEWYSVEFCK